MSTTSHSNDPPYESISDDDDYSVISEAECFPSQPGAYVNLPGRSHNNPPTEANPASPLMPTHTTDSQATGSFHDGGTSPKPNEPIKTEISNGEANLDTPVMSPEDLALFKALQSLLGDMRELRSALGMEVAMKRMLIDDAAEEKLRLVDAEIEQRREAFDAELRQKRKAYRNFKQRVRREYRPDPRMIEDIVSRTTAHIADQISRQIAASANVSSHSSASYPNNTDSHIQNGQGTTRRAREINKEEGPPSYNNLHDQRSGAGVASQRTGLST